MQTCTIEKNTRKMNLKPFKKIRKITCRGGM